MNVLWHIKAHHFQMWLMWNHGASINLCLVWPFPLLHICEYIYLNGYICLWKRICEAELNVWWAKCDAENKNCKLVLSFLVLLEMTVFGFDWHFLCVCNGPIDKRKQHLVLFHLVLIICMIIIIITHPTDCTSKSSDTYLYLLKTGIRSCPWKKKERKENIQNNRLECKNKKRMGFESAESLSAAHAAQDSTTLPDSVYLFDLFYTVRRNRYPLFWWMVFVCPHLQAQSMKKNPSEMLYFYPAQKVIGCQIFSCSYFFYLFHFTPLIFFFLICFNFYNFGNIIF